MTINAQAYAKLNLFLDITGIMPNGYHYLNNVTQSVSLSDSVTVRAEASNTTSILIRCDNPAIPCDEKNTAYRAAIAYLKEIREDAEIEITIKKLIPVMGGMGGSSVDAAAVLSALNAIFQGRLTEDELMELGEKIGADVPLCIKGGTLFSDGKQGTVSSLPDIEECYFVCVKPDFSCSTAEAYSLYDRHPTEENHYCTKFISDLCDGGLKNACQDIYNIFTKLYNDNRIEAVKQKLKKYGAENAEMTGSGSVVFGIFSDLTSANLACVQLLSEYPDTFVCHPTQCGVSLY